MKKKIAVALTALMMLSCSTVFMAAQSPAAGVTVETPNVTVETSEVTTSEATDVVVENIEGVEAENIESITVVELKGTVPEDGKVTLVVDGVKDGDAVRALHDYEGAWVERPASVVNGKVVVDFAGAKHFSPVIIVKVVEDGETSVEPDGLPAWGQGWPWNELAAAGSASNATATTAATAATLPKTGAVVVLPFAAMACLAGAVVCGRKAK